MHDDHPDAEITIEFGFDPDGVWLVRIQIRFPGGVIPAPESPLWRDSQAALKDAINGGLIEGERQGATVFKLVLDAPPDFVLDDGLSPLSSN